VTVTEPASDAASATSSQPATRSRGESGLHPTGLVVAVVGLLLSSTAFFVAYRDLNEREDQRLEEIVDQASDGVTDALRDVEDLVTGVEGTIIATQEANQEELERLMSMQVAGSDLISSATLLKAEEGSGLNFFGTAGESEYLGLDLAAEPEVLEERIAALAAIPDGSVQMLTNTDDITALAASFTTQPDDGGPPESWVGEVLTAERRADAGPTAPPQGLFLLVVHYKE
jgi:hypothetical protein